MHCFQFLFIIIGVCISTILNASPDKVRLTVNAADILPHTSTEQRVRYQALAANQNPTAVLEAFQKSLKEKQAILDSVFGNDLASHWRLADGAADAMTHLQGYLELVRLRSLPAEFETQLQNKSLAKEGGDGGRAQLAADILAANDRLFFLEILAHYAVAMNQIKATPPKGLEETAPGHFAGWQINGSFIAFQKIGPAVRELAPYWKYRQDPFGKGIGKHFAFEEPIIADTPKNDAERRALADAVDARIYQATQRAIFIETEIQRLKKDNKKLARDFLIGLESPENKKIIVGIEIELGAQRKAAAEKK